MEIMMKTLKVGTNLHLSNKLSTTSLSLDSILGMIICLTIIRFNNFPRLTIATACSMTDEMILVDMNGAEHKMSTIFVVIVLIIGWVSFLLAILTNCIYYVVHPMALKVNPKDKLKTYIFGQLWDIRECKLSSSKVGENGDNDESQTMMEMGDN